MSRRCWKLISRKLFWGIEWRTDWLARPAETGRGETRKELEQLRAARHCRCCCCTHSGMWSHRYARAPGLARSLTCSSFFSAASLHSSSSSSSVRNDADAVRAAAYYFSGRHITRTRASRCNSALTRRNVASDGDRFIGNERHMSMMEENYSAEVVHPEVYPVQRLVIGSS